MRHDTSDTGIALSCTWRGDTLRHRCHDINVAYLWLGMMKSLLNTASPFSCSPTPPISLLLRFMWSMWYGGTRSLQMQEPVLPHVTSNIPFIPLNKIYIFDAMVFKGVTAPSDICVGLVDDKLSPKKVPLFNSPFLCLPSPFFISYHQHPDASSMTMLSLSALYSKDNSMQFFPSCCPLKYIFQTYIQVTNHGTSSLLKRTVYIASNIYGTPQYHTSKPKPRIAISNIYLG